MSASVIDRIPEAAIQPPGPVSDLDGTLWRGGTERGQRMASFLESQMGRPLADARLLEIGVGGGGIAAAFSEKARRVIASDYFRETLVKAAAHEKFQRERIPRIQLDAIALPFAARSFDAVILNGVLEYVGCRDGQVSPGSHQMAALTEIRRVLAPHGSFYFAIENRFDPHSLFADPHTGQPLVAMLPRGLANRVSLALNGKPYRHWLYSLPHLTQLLRNAGFEKIKGFVTIPSYQFPRVYQSVDDMGGLAEAWNRADQAGSAAFETATRLSWRGAMWVRLLGLLRLAHLAPSFVFVCQ